MKPVVIVYSPLSDPLLLALRNDCELIYFPEGITPQNQVDFDQALARAEGLLGSLFVKLKIDAQLLVKAPKLRVVSTISVGYDHCDVPALTQRGVLLTHTPDVLTDSTADTAFMLLMTAARRFVELDHVIRQQQWTGNLPPTYYGKDIHHKTLGIIGLGRIGAAIAQRAHAGFNMRILYSGNSRKPTAEAAYQAEFCELDDLLARSDFVCLAAPLTPDTRGLINRERIAKMKPEAIFINIARGAMVDEIALIEALRTGKIRAAGLDVFQQEPLPADSPLFDLPNVVLLPHVGSATTETRLAMDTEAVNNMLQGLKGTLRINCVNPKQKFQP